MYTVARELHYLAFLEEPPRDMTIAYVKRNIAENWPHVIALDGDKVIAWADVAPLNRPVFEHAGVLGIGIIPGYRGQGLGRKLVHTVLDAAKKRGLSRVELTVRESNLIAIKLYENFGFFHEDRHINTVKINGEYENHLSMALFIPENA
ncbi:MAG: GNAT family N-acetyltransferase [Methylococcales bacterium]